MRIWQRNRPAHVFVAPKPISGGFDVLPRKDGTGVHGHAGLWLSSGGTCAVCRAPLLPGEAGYHDATASTRSGRIPGSSAWQNPWRARAVSIRPTTCRTGACNKRSAENKAGSAHAVTADAAPVAAPCLPGSGVWSQRHLHRACPPLPAPQEQPPGTSRDKAACEPGQQAHDEDAHDAWIAALSALHPA